jgi:hypothetical protein
MMNEDSIVPYGPVPPPSFPPTDERVQKRLYELSLISLFVEALDEEDKKVGAQKSVVVSLCAFTWIGSNMYKLS